VALASSRDLSRDLRVLARGVAASVGRDLGAVDGHDADLGQTGPGAQAEHHAKPPGQRPLVALDEPRDRRVIGLGVHGDDPEGDVVFGGTLDRPGRPRPAAIGVYKSATIIDGS
jgi:hypothetical protein